MSSLPASAQVASSSEDAQPDGRPARGSTAHRPKPGRKVYLDCINVLAIIGVVALHNRFNYRVVTIRRAGSSRTSSRVPRLPPSPLFMASGITSSTSPSGRASAPLQEALHENPGSPADLGADYLFARSWFTHTPLPKGEEILAVLLAHRAPWA